MFCENARDSPETKEINRYYDLLRNSAYFSQNYIALERIQKNVMMNDYYEKSKKKNRWYMIFQ